MPLCRFRIRTLMMVVLVVVLELTAASLIHQMRADEASSHPGKTPVIAIACVVIFLASVRLMTEAIRDVTGSPRQK